jgi:hypothetical protein
MNCVPLVRISNKVLFADYIHFMGSPVQSVGSFDSTAFPGSSTDLKTLVFTSKPLKNPTQTNTKTAFTTALPTNTPVNKFAAKKYSDLQ